MEIVINIPDGCYEELTTANFPIQDAYRLVAWIKNGTPLPKGHGDLIDKDRLLDELEKTVKSVGDNKQFLFWNRAVAYVHLSEPIIEADKETENES